MGEIYAIPTDSTTTSVTGFYFLAPFEGNIESSDCVEENKLIKTRKGKDRNNFRKKWKNKFYH